MKKKLLLLPAAAVATLLAAGAWLGLGQRQARLFTLYGNVDDRQVNLSFNLAERLASVKVEEGDKVKKGQLVATLETERIDNSLAAARAARDMAQAELTKLKNGTRKEDVDIARSLVAAAEARVVMTKSDHIRQQTLKKTDAVSVQDAERAEENYRLALAGLDAAKSNLAKQIAGPRKEDIASAEARFAQMEAQLATQQQNLKDAKLFAPCDGIVRNRLLEPGEMVNPQTPIVTMAEISPKWVRVYLPETMLTRIKSGERARIELDSMPGKQLDGWVGFISPTAEFTPKNVETPELRTSLVYEVRVMVKDPDNLLKLGSPATVVFPGVRGK